MSKVRSSGSKPEIVMRKIVCSLTDLPVRFNAKNLPGKPDIVIHRMKLAVFVDGCFWHMCPQHCKIPKAHREFWKEKIFSNAARDDVVTSELQDMGWIVWRYWEHALKGDETISNTRRNVRIRLRRLEYRLSIKGLKR
jgi:DNA mismatch endonuclease (patch repair protein)